MEAIEEFLIKEFEQQHQNIREIANLTFQKIQFFLNLETFIFGALLTIFSLGIKDIINYLFLPALFLSFFGHMVFVTAVHAIVQEISLDFVNHVIRVYFKNKYRENKAHKYIYFARDFEEKYLSILREIDSNYDIYNEIRWKNNKDPSVFIALFVGNINSFNLTLFIISSLLTIFNITKIYANLYALFGLGIPLFFIVKILYLRAFFERKLDYEQRNIMQDWLVFLRNLGEF